MISEMPFITVCLYVKNVCSNGSEIVWMIYNSVNHILLEILIANFVIWFSICLAKIKKKETLMLQFSKAGHDMES